MKFKRVGKCNKCRECCKTETSEWFMTGYDIKGPRTTGCIYLEAQPDESSDCLIESGKIKFDSLPKNVQEYYLQECLSFPDAKEPEHCPPIYALPKSCGYSITEVK